jgi:hypothetical protein
MGIAQGADWDYDAEEWIVSNFEAEAKEKLRLTDNQYRYALTIDGSFPKVCQIIRKCCVIFHIFLITR